MSSPQSATYRSQNLIILFRYRVRATGALDRRRGAGLIKINITHKYNENETPYGPQ
jgi:hypothetical protein